MPISCKEKTITYLDKLDLNHCELIGLAAITYQELETSLDELIFILSDYREYYEDEGRTAVLASTITPNIKITYSWTWINRYH